MACMHLHRSFAPLLFINTQECRALSRPAALLHAGTTPHCVASGCRHRATMPGQHEGCSLAHAQLLTTSITSHRLLTSLLGANAGQQFVCAPLNSPVLFCHLPLQLCGPLGRGLRDGPRA